MAASTIRLVPAELVKCPPSVAEGTLTLEEETVQRAYGCGWIQQACVLLRLPAVTMASAQSIFHRFYYRRSMGAFDVKVIAAASVYLSGKLCETPRRVRDIVYVYVFMDWLEIKRVKNLELRSLWQKQQQNATEGVQATAAQDVSSTSPAAVESDQEQQQGDDATSHKNVGQILDLIHKLEAELQFPVPNSKEFRRLKTYIHRAERHILRETGFLVSQALVHPHRFILQYIHSLLGTTVVSEESKKTICQRAWGYLNDSMRTQLCCAVQPAVLTAAAIHMACNDLGLELPRHLSWPLCFDVTWAEIDSVERALTGLYQAAAPVYRKLADPPLPPAAVITMDEEDAAVGGCASQVEQEVLAHTDSKPPSSHTPARATAAVACDMSNVVVGEATSPKTAKSLRLCAV